MIDIEKEREVFDEFIKKEFKSLWDAKDSLNFFARNTFDSMFASWLAAKQSAVPDGYVVVSVDSTNKMACAAKSVDGRLSAFKYGDVYKAMIEAGALK